MSEIIEFLTIEEIKKLIKEEKDKRYKLAYALGFGSGLRISEIIGGQRKNGEDIPPLSSKNVDLKTHQIKVIQGKGKKDRITVTSPWLNKENLKLLPIKIQMRTFQIHFNKHTKKVLGKRCNTHMMRHGFGNHMHVEKAVPLTVLQVLMGHQSIRTTAIYAKSNPKQAVNKAWESF